MFGKRREDLEPLQGNEAATLAKIDKEVNPEPDSHNLGQPVRRQTDERGEQRSKFFTDCKTEHGNSLRCIEENYEKKDVCQPFFDAYRQCRKAEHDRRLEENARMSGADGGSGCIIQ